MALQLLYVNNQPSPNKKCGTKSPALPYFMIFVIT